jgi:hypothetical protein
MSHHHTGNEIRKPQARPDPERRDPPGNPSGNTAPRTRQEADPERVERGREEWDRTIAT